MMTPPTQKEIADKGSLYNRDLRAEALKIIAQANSGTGAGCGANWLMAEAEKLIKYIENGAD